MTFLCASLLGQGLHIGISEHCFIMTKKQTAKVKVKSDL